MTTIEKSEIDRAIAQAVAELIAHGGSKADVAQMVQQFKTLVDDEDNKVTDKQIPV